MDSTQLLMATLLATTGYDHREFTLEKIQAANERKSSKNHNLNTSIQEAQNTQADLFTKDNIVNVYFNVMRNSVEIPFEVVGYKCLFMHMLNKAHITGQEAELLTGQHTHDIGAGLRDKLKLIVTQTLEQAREKIESDHRADEVAWQEPCYKYNREVSLLDYIVNVDLERALTKKDLEDHYLSVRS